MAVMRWASALWLRQNPIHTSSPMRRVRAATSTLLHSSAHVTTTVRPSLGNALLVITDVSRKPSLQTIYQLQRPASSATAPVPGFRPDGTTLVPSMPGRTALRCVTTVRPHARLPTLPITAHILRWGSLVANRATTITRAFISNATCTTMPLIVQKLTAWVAMMVRMPEFVESRPTIRLRLPA